MSDTVENFDPDNIKWCQNRIKILEAECVRLIHGFHEVQAEIIEAQEDKSIRTAFVNLIRAEGRIIKALTACPESVKLVGKDD